MHFFFSKFQPGRLNNSLLWPVLSCLEKLGAKIYNNYSFHEPLKLYFVIAKKCIFYPTLDGFHVIFFYLKCT